MTSFRSHITELVSELKLDSKPLHCDAQNHQVPELALYLSLIGIIHQALKHCIW